MNKCAVSVVVVNYNGNSFLKDLLDMLWNQTFHNFEIIFVDDGSYDDSLKTIRKSTPKMNVKILELDHVGVGCARQKGIEASNGKYIMFVDVDDYIMPKYIETYYRSIEKEHCDVLLVNVLKGKNLQNAHVVQIPKEIGTSHISEYLLSGVISGWLFQTISRRKVWIGKERFGKVNYAEDVFALLLLASEGYEFKVATDCEPQYFYKQNLNSITENPSWRNIRSMTDAAEFFYESNLEDKRRRLYHQFSRKLMLNALGQALVSGNNELVTYTKKKLLSKRKMMNFSVMDVIRINFGLYAIRNRISSILFSNMSVEKRNV